MKFGFTAKVSLIVLALPVFSVLSAQAQSQTPPEAHAVKDLSRYHGGVPPKPAALVYKAPVYISAVADSSAILNLDAKPIQQARPMMAVPQQNTATVAATADLNAQLKTAQARYTAAKAEYKAKVKAKDKAGAATAKATMLAAQKEVTSLKKQIKAQAKPVKKTAHQAVKHSTGGTAAKSSTTTVKK